MLNFVIMTPMGLFKSVNAGVLLISASIGYISLTQETLWMRAVSYMTGGAPPVFAHVLGCFLVGIAIGALVSEIYSRRNENNPDADPARFISVSLLLGAVFYPVSLWGVAWINSSARFHTMGIFSIYVAVAILAAIQGGIFPILCHLAVKKSENSTVDMSKVYMANILGCTVGPLLTGFWLMDLFTLQQLVLIITQLTLVLAIIVRPPAMGKWGATHILSLASLALIPMAHPSMMDGLFEKLHYGSSTALGHRYKNIAQNRSGVIAVDYGENNTDILYGGGMYDGNFNVDPYIDSNGITRAYYVGALHPKPRRTLEIGLASGSWSRVLMGYGAIEKHEIVEINPGYLDLISRYSPQKDLLNNPKVQIHIDDGRRWLQRNTDAKFDLILQNTTWHWRSGISNLLSKDYWEMCKTRLAEGGVVYFNTTHDVSRDVDGKFTDDAAKTAAAVFKHVIKFQHFVAASDSPFNLTKDQIRENLMKFDLGDGAVFSTEDNKTVLERLVAVEQVDLGDELRANPNCRVITDNNMACEFERKSVTDSNKGWIALFKRLR